MNCPKCRGKLEYLPEKSNPRGRKLVFYCKNCKAFRLIYEFPSKDILSVLLDNIDLKNILPSEFQEEPRSKNEVLEYPSVSE